MRAGGVLLVVLGVLVLLAGLGMDTTETTTTCYEADYSWDTADSSGCVQTTYSDPAPKIAAVSIGFGMILGGGVLARRGRESDSTPSPRGRVGDPRRDETAESGADSTAVRGSGTETFAERLREHQDDE